MAPPVNSGRSRLQTDEIMFAGQIELRRSSTVTIRSCSGMKAASAFRNVVLPEAVPPLMKMFCGI